MNTKDAIYAAVHDYKGGAPALAARMGMAASSLQSMANPNLDSHDWNLRRFRQLLTYTDDMRPLQALAAEFGGVFLRTTMHSDESLPEAFKALADLAAEFGRVANETQAAMQDGRISINEARRIGDQCMELMQGAANMMRTVDELAAQSPKLRAVQ